MNDKLVKSGLAAVSTIGFLLLGSCSSTPPNDAIFNSRGGHVPPPTSAGNTVNLTKPVVVPAPTPGNNGLILNNNGPGAGIVIDDSTPPPAQDFSFQSPAVNKVTYKVQKNDSLWKVARNHGVSMQDLARENNLTTKSQLKIGQTLTLPAGARLIPESQRKPIKSSATSKSSAGSQKYKVKKGDSLSVIAYKYKTTVAALKSSNGLSSNTIRVNQTLTIPNKNSPRSTSGMGSSNSGSNSGFKATGNVYTVKKGDSLSVIAHKHGTTVSKLKQANGLKSNNIIVGKKLVLPGGSKKATPPKKSNKQKDLEKEIFGVKPKSKPKKKEEPKEMVQDNTNPFEVKEPETNNNEAPAEVKKENQTPPPSMKVMDVLVVESDTLESLANDFNTTVELIKKANPKVKGNEDLKPGSVIKVPRG